ncbi:Uncharacterized protein ABC855_g2789 [[Candida] zeylanoides]
MDWYTMRAKRSSVSSGGSYGLSYTNMRPPLGATVGAGGVGGGGVGGGAPSRLNGAPYGDYESKSSFYLSPTPLYCSDWVTSVETDCVAVSSYKEDSANTVQILHGVAYGADAATADDDQAMGSPGSSAPSHAHSDAVAGFDFYQVAHTSCQYPITNLQWDPAMSRGQTATQRLAASSEVFRLYQLERDDLSYRIRQTHIFANSSADSGGNGSHITPHSAAADTTNGDKSPPITSFDWNKTDPSIVITSSVDTTCTIWDLSRSHQLDSTTDTAAVKTQLIAHDSEVFDVKFIHDSVHLFASVGNDGSIRVFDLRSLEHSTIIYEPPTAAPSTAAGGSRAQPLNAHSHALLKLTTSNLDQHHLATIGANSNQVIVIDMRMPGVPVARLDGSFDGINSAAINSIKWHPNSNYLLTGGDDCQALVWDCNTLQAEGVKASDPFVVDSPLLAHEADLEVNSVTWRADEGDWLGVVAGKGFQAVSL